MCQSVNLNETRVALPAPINQEPQGVLFSHEGVEAGFKLGDLADGPRRARAGWPGLDLLGAAQRLAGAGNLGPHRFFALDQRGPVHAPSSGSSRANASTTVSASDCSL